jgi:hypothetical protein
MAYRRVYGLFAYVSIPEVVRIFYSLFPPIKAAASRGGMSKTISISLLNLSHLVGLAFLDVPA